MKYKYKKNSIIFFSIAFFLLVIVPNAYASKITLFPSSTNVGIGEQFYVDITVDPEGVAMNGIEGSVSFPENNLSFLRAENGTSIINTWIEAPSLRGGVITFAGIVPNGFNGLIDPFNNSKLLPGQIVRLVFEGKNPGTGLFTFFQINLTKNDGLGTVENISPTSSSIAVSNQNKPTIYKLEDAQRPFLLASIIRDPNIYDNKYVLIFQASDKETGIKNVMVDEGDGTWKEVESPYLLSNQSRSSIIKIQATDFSGNITTVEIQANIFAKYSYLWIIFSILIIGILFFIIYKRKYVHKK